MSEFVTYRLDGPIAAISVDDGKVNALSVRMLSAINAALDRAQQDRAIVVLEGRHGVFSAGFDLSVLKAGGSDARAMLRAGFELSYRLLSFPLPVVAACSGHAVAMGAFLLLSADYRVCAEGPFKIGANEVAIGLTMPHSALTICRQRLSTPHFTRAVINAEMFQPTEAVVAGFVDRVVSETALAETAREAAMQLARLDLAAHEKSKLRAREAVLLELRAAIEVDDATIAAR
jgi:enoyl-CoA hydratase